MLIEFAQELKRILTEVETLTRENEELKAEKETFNSHLITVHYLQIMFSAQAIKLIG